MGSNLVHSGESTIDQAHCSPVGVEVRPQFFSRLSGVSGAPRDVPLRSPAEGLINSEDPPTWSDTGGEADVNGG